MKKNEKIFMLIEVVYFGNIPFYELYEDVAYGYERYNELQDDGNDGLSFVYIMEHMLKDYYATGEEGDNFDEDDMDAFMDLDRRLKIELELIWKKLHN